MAKPRIISLLFPLGGVGGRAGVRASTEFRGPYPTPWSSNVRSQDSIADRIRGGSFTAIAAGARPSEIVYRDRLLTFDSNAITASRQGLHTDLDLDVDLSDTMRATVFQFSEADEIGGDVVALVPHKDSFLLGFTATETWVQQGDPLTGIRRNVSREVGIIGADAWCKNHDTVYFLSSRGLYSVNADGSGLKALSEDKVPEDLTGVSDSSCTLTYQHSDRGAYIHNTGTDWFYDTARDGFWPFDTDSTDSHALVGPLRLGRNNRFGLIQSLHGMIATGSGTVNWRIVPGNTAEEAAANGKAAIEAFQAGSSYASYVKASGSFVAGRSHTFRPRVEAMFACLWLQSTTAWAYEGITMQTGLSGSWR